jgi:hypothetical protein
MIVAPDKPPDGARAAPALAYDRAGPYATRRGFRLLLVLTLLNTLMLAGFVVGPQIKPFAAEQWQQWQAARAAQRQLQVDAAVRHACLAYAPPAGLVAYEEDPAEAAKLLAPGDGKYGSAVPGLGAPSQPAARVRGPGDDPAVPSEFQPPVRASLPDAFTDFDGRANQTLFGGVTEPALLFLHERTTPRGTKHLVVVRLYPGYEFGSHDTFTDDHQTRTWTLGKSRRLAASAWDYPAPPASPRLASVWSVLLALPDRQRTLAEMPVRPRPVDASAALVSGAADEHPPVPIDYGNRLRVYAGQADPADASHFTIAYQLDGKAGTIDGWAKDTGVVLRPREGAPVAPDGGSSQAFNEFWDLTATPPASRPAAPPQ